MLSVDGELAIGYWLLVDRFTGALRGTESPEANSQ